MEWVRRFEWKKCVWRERREYSAEREKWEMNLICASSLNIKRISMDRSIYRALSSTKSWQKWICRGSIDSKNTSMDWGSVENLLARQKVAQWIKEAVEHLSRRDPEVSMDWDFDKINWEKKKGLDRRESVKDLLRSYRAWRKGIFQRREKHIEMNATSKLLNDRCKQHIKSLKTSLNIYAKHSRSKTHTHTLNRSN